ncbi:glycosyltransferase family 4 protein [Clostridium beijerinckii]|uniref:glycosyltransferase family 4 protein n=1 Tax=Clostridium beijerinckii TaxID=1520 RepID=UPI00080A16DB|nr:glycosyltransferase family 4 protein [Clostridium beijerinckii]OCA99778.1 hypothetical protein BGS1_17165 [Clostridium beijerinckii]
MKVLVVTHIADLSGANKSLLSILEKLQNKVEFAVLVNEKKGELIDSLKALNIKIIYAKYDWWYAEHRDRIYKGVARFVIDGTMYYAHHNVSYSLLEKLRTEQFDLVYTNTSTIDFGAIVAEKLNISHVWHIREFGKEDFGFISLVSSKHMAKRFQAAKAIITISNALGEKYKELIAVNKLKVIYNGFNIDELYCPPRRHNLDQQINILIAGQVCAAKGQNQAIDAVANLVQTGLPVKLYIAGEMDTQYINSTLAKYENHDWVVTLGQVKNMYELRKDIDIELICSRSEAFGRVTLEAMLHGIPVVGSDAGGTRELINNRETGLLYEYGDVNQLAENIALLIKDKNLYDSIINNASNFAKQFTIQKTVNEILKVFNDINLQM